MARITFVSRMTVKAGKEAEFERIVRGLTADVRRHEKDAIYFEFFRLREPRRYAVLESSASEAAEQAHMQSPWLAGVLDGLVACVEGTGELSS